MEIVSCFLTHFFSRIRNLKAVVPSLSNASFPLKSDTSISSLIFAVVLTILVPSICHLIFFTAVLKVLILSLFISDSVHHSVSLISSNDQCSLLPWVFMHMVFFCLEWSFLPIGMANIYSVFKSQPKGYNFQKVFLIFYPALIS